MNAMDLFEQVAALRREGQSFALATVVARRAPVSAHLGDRAIVFADGRMEGFVGGACSREIIRQQALDALKTRCSRLVSIRPDASDSGRVDRRACRRPDDVCRRKAPSTSTSSRSCRRDDSSSSAPRRLPSALARLARSMDYDVVRVVDASRAARHRAGGRDARCDGCDARGDRGDPARGRPWRRRSCGCRRIARALRRRGARIDPEVRRAVRRARRIAHARRGRARAARGTRRARRRRDSESGGARSRRADSARSRAVDPRGNRPGASRRHARGGDGTAGGHSHRRAAAAGGRRRSGVRHERDVASARHTADDRRRRVLLLLRELPRDVSQGPPGVPGPAHDQTLRPSTTASASAASSSTRRSPPRCRSCSRSRSRCSSRGRPASARPRARKCSPRCSAPS